MTRPDWKPIHERLAEMTLTDLENYARTLAGLWAVSDRLVGRVMDELARRGLGQRYAEIVAEVKVARVRASNEQAERIAALNNSPQEAKG